MVETEWLTPATISEQSGLKAGTVRPAVRELEDEDIAKDDSGSYRIPTHGLTRVQEHIKASDNE